MKLYISRYKKQISSIVIALFSFFSFASYVIWRPTFLWKRATTVDGLFHGPYVEKSQELEYLTA